MKKLSLLLLFVLTTITATSQEVAEKTVNAVLDVSNYKEVVVGKDVQLVDVRTPDEYNAGKIDDAINIDYFDQETFKKEFEKLDKNKAIYVYCRSGHRSHESAVILEKMGFKEIYDLKGGYIAWSEKN